MQHLPRRHRAPLATLIIAVLLAAGCSESTDPPTTTAKDAPAGSTSTAAPSTTAPAVPEADEATVALAEAATIQDSDFSDPWTVYDEAQVVGADANLCDEGSDVAVSALPRGAIQQGDYMQFGDEQSWVISTSYVFEETAQAEAWVTWIDGQEWVDCWMEIWQAQQDDTGATFDVRLKTRENPALGTEGFESYAEVEILDAEGTLVTVYSIQVFRIENVVMHVSLTIGQIEDAPYATFYDEYGSALSAVYDRVEALL